MFQLQDYGALYTIVFRDGYPGYKPAVKEIPNGDGKVDRDKRYAHVALKYLTGAIPEADESLLRNYLIAAHQLAERAFEAAGIDPAFKPDIRYGALRVLEYPVGATSNLHEDFDLFTLMMYRDQPKTFIAHDEGILASETIQKIRRLNSQAHLGEIGEIVGLGAATPHEVIASDRPQYSIVYFAIPDHAAVLPGGTTVGDWIKERVARSRTY